MVDCEKRMGDFQSRNGTAILIVTVGWLLVGWFDPCAHSNMHGIKSEKSPSQIRQKILCPRILYELLTKEFERFMVELVNGRVREK